MDSGVFSSQPGVSFRLRHFSASLVPIGKTLPGCLLKTTVVSRGEIFVSNDSLTKLFTAKLENSSTSIQDLKIENGVGKVRLEGKMKKVIPISFAIEGPVTTDGTVLSVDAAHIKADGIPIKGLLEMVGQHLSSVLGLNNVTGITVHDNTLTFAPEQIAHLKGHIASVETTPEGLILRYGRAARTAAAAVVAKTPPS